MRVCLSRELNVNLLSGFPDSCPSRMICVYKPTFRNRSPLVLNARCRPPVLSRSPNEISRKRTGKFRMLVAQSLRQDTTLARAGFLQCKSTAVAGLTFSLVGKARQQFSRSVAATSRQHQPRNQPRLTSINASGQTQYKKQNNPLHSTLVQGI